MNSASAALPRIRAVVIETVKNAFRVWCMLLRAMIPVTILMKVLMELDLLKYLVAPFKPIMALVGLPADLGIAWLTTMCVNIYTGIFVYADILKTLPDPLTVAQVTTFATMVLIAHTLFVEGKVAQYCGLSMSLQMGIRVAAGLLFGVLFFRICAAGGLLTEPAVMLYTPAPAPDSHLVWALRELRSFILLFFVISGLMLFMRLLTALRVTALLNSLLSPLLRLMGIAPEAATITVLGLTSGLAYGGGLIINEARSGTLQHRDIFTSVTLMGLSHAIVEDTLIMAALGASLSGTLFGRLVFTLVVMMVLARLLRRFSRAAKPESLAGAA